MTNSVKKGQGSTIALIVALGVVFLTETSAQSVKCKVSIKLDAMKKDMTSVGKACTSDMAKGQDCFVKCVLQKMGHVTKENKLDTKVIKQFIQKYSNAKAAYVDGFVAAYENCRKDADSQVASLKKAGKKVTDCSFFGYLGTCVEAAHKKLESSGKNC